ncbi:uroporphyrinogen-III C-methyltransferase [Clostridium ganghwense]|uniref:uroporphyrinogen-III C-methyltransferase n=1 Tax=Clostridium ganghwense TaxID=312089 RepID=A0ABT4CSZ2_9CLOT|nr:uroporphyrinogen-III C-methyltransferase [Clostridium ganghwense]MCY6372185.1 uroporphyrinogen-III C-methyltransferase [Clostridium ganghwense]
MGKVYLIGAGPGDEGLMTVKAAKVLKECTAVLYDRLSGNNVLKHINEECKVFYCGKEPGCHYKTQEEINDMIVSLSKEGHIVGRVKGGDPYVFGRGGEEALRLYEEGIEFEVIPGVTSAISVLNYAGIPITHRGIAQSFHVFTGRSSKNLDISWESVANLKGTLVFLMGLKNIEGITNNLISNGMDENTPCAVIMRGTTSKQKRVTGNLKSIGDKVREAGFTSPCIIVVGKVVEFTQELGWYEKKPLFGWNVCVTRSKEQAKSLSDKLLNLGAEVTEINSIKIKSTSSNLQNYMNKLENYDYIVFTSVNTVNIFFDYLKEREFDIRKLKARVAAIGRATESSIKERGIIPDITAGEFVAEELFKCLKSEVQEGDKVLIPCSRDSRQYLYEELIQCGCQVDRVHIYYPDIGEIVNVNSFNDVDIVLFTSPSTVRNMIKMVGIEEISKKICVAIGPITEKELVKNNIECFVCDEYCNEGLIKKLLQLKEDNIPT